MTQIPKRPFMPPSRREISRSEAFPDPRHRGELHSRRKVKPRYIAPGASTGYVAEGAPMPIIKRGRRSLPASLFLKSLSRQDRRSRATSSAARSKTTSCAVSTARRSMTQPATAFAPLATACNCIGWRRGVVASALAFLRRSDRPRSLRPQGQTMIGPRRCAPRTIDRPYA
jgi:hypothetical protein